MSSLAWPAVALCYAYVFWRFLEGYLRGLRSERQVLAAGLDELRARFVALQAQSSAVDELSAKVVAINNRLGSSRG